MPDARDAQVADLGRTFRKEVDGLYRYARRILGDAAEAEDAVQDAFLRLTRRDEGAEEMMSLRAFVYRVVRNVCIDRLRRRSRQPQMVTDEGLESYPAANWTASTPETKALTSESFRRIADAMKKLPDVEGEALSLVVVEGLSYREVSVATAVPIGTVRSRLNRARQNLRAMLQDDQLPLTGDETDKVVRLPRKRS